jgi:hypothetical protein
MAARHGIAFRDNLTPRQEGGTPEVKPRRSDGSNDLRRLDWDQDSPAGTNGTNTLGALDNSHGKTRPTLPPRARRNRFPPRSAPLPLASNAKRTSGTLEKTGCVSLISTGDAMEAPGPLVTLGSRSTAKRAHFFPRCISGNIGI